MRMDEVSSHQIVVRSLQIIPTKQPGASGRGRLPAKRAVAAKCTEIAHCSKTNEQT